MKEKKVTWIVFKKKNAINFILNFYKKKVEWVWFILNKCSIVLAFNCLIKKLNKVHERKKSNMDGFKKKESKAQLTLF